MNFAIVLRKIRGRFDAFFRNGTNLIVGGESPAARGGTGAGMLMAVFAVFLALIAPIAMLAAIAFTFHVAGDHAGVALAFPALAAIPAGIKKKQNDLDALLTELQAGQEEMSKGRIEAKRGEELDAKAAEAAVLQDELDRWYRNNDLISKGRQVDSPLLPQNRNGGGSGDGHPLSGGPDEIVGYMTLGKAFVESNEYKQLAAQGFPATREIVAPFEASFHASKTGYGVVAITRKMLEGKDGKAVPTLGAGVIRADRLGDIVRNPERARLTIRDLVNKSNTTSNSIEYVTVVYTEAAAPVAESGEKPESALVYGTGPHHRRHDADHGAATSGRPRSSEHHR
jgi:hypothetical protein